MLSPSPQPRGATPSQPRRLPLTREHVRELGRSAYKLPILGLSTSTVRSSDSPPALSRRSSRSRVSSPRLNRRKNSALADFRAWVIDPRASSVMPIWDLVMLGALCFVATVVPYELSFLEDPKWNTSPLGYSTTLFVMNRIVDVIFMIDMVFCFRLMFFDSRSGQWVSSVSRIARHYLLGWFILDFISVFPFWALPLLLSDYESAVGDVARTFRLVRFTRLARMLKANRVIERQVQDLLMGRLEFSYATITLLKLVIALLVWSHWQACLWYLLPLHISNHSSNWISVFEESFVCADGRDPCVALPGDAYAAALYFSVMTITSVGYGEMLPLNTSERVICSLLMLLSGLAWAYIIGQTAGILTTLSPDTTRFRNTMDDLNFFMRARRLPPATRHALRDFFVKAREVHKANADSALLSKLSPFLQEKVAFEANRSWIEQIWYFKSLSSTKVGCSFIATIAQHIVVRAYVEQERFPIGYLYVLRRGLAVKNWQLYSVGGVWGDDMILDKRQLLDHSQAVALTFCEAYTLRREDLDDVLDEYPELEALVRLASRRLAIQRLLLIALKGDQPIRSFIPRHQARGFTLVRTQPSLEQKLTALFEENMVEHSGSVGPRKAPAFMISSPHLPPSSPIARRPPSCTVAALPRLNQSHSDSGGKAGVRAAPAAKPDGCSGRPSPLVFRRSNSAGKPLLLRRTEPTKHLRDELGSLRRASQAFGARPLGEGSPPSPVENVTVAQVDDGSRQSTEFHDDVDSQLERLMEMQRDLAAEMSSLCARVAGMSKSHELLRESLEQLKERQRSSPAEQRESEAMHLEAAQGARRRRSVTLSAPTDEIRKRTITDTASMPVLGT